MDKKELLKNVAVTEDLFGEHEENISTFESVMQEMKNYIKEDDESLYVKMKDFFTGENADVTVNYDFITKDELPDNEEFIEKAAGYTYNDRGYTERDFVYKVAEDSEGKGYAFISIHIGLDARRGFTNYFIIKFDNFSDWEEYVNHSVSVAYISLGDRNISVDVLATYEAVNVYDDKTGNDYQLGLDLSDKKELLDSLKEFFDDKTEENISSECWSKAELF